MTRIRNLITKACRPSHWLAGCYTGAGWLMQSNKTAKEKALFIGWAIMISIVVAQAVQLLIK